MTNRIVVKAQDGDTRISRHVYGHFSEHLGRCIYGGYWVGNDEAALSQIPNTRGIRDDVAAALRAIRIPNLRWPGGCFADEYHWRDGIGPRAARPRMVNTHWGGVVEDNSFGTHEFLDLCAQISSPGRPCEPYICGNVGSGTVQEFSQWVEYCNFDGESPMANLRAANGRPAPFNVRLWGVGNESWGCGGSMTPEFYADNYRRYATYARAYGPARPFKIACGPNSDDYRWTEVLMDKAGRQMDGLALHYYTVPGDWSKKGSATEFDERDWYLTLRKAMHTQTLIERHGAIMDRFDPARRVALVMDEWGTWFDVEPGTNPGFLYQQNTLRDALVAAVHLNIFNNHAERLRVANLAQTVNVLQAVILTEGPRLVRTPTWHVFDLYKEHQDALRLPVHVESDTHGGGPDGGLPLITASASEDDDRRVHISIANASHDHEQAVRVDLRGVTLTASAGITGRVLTADTINAHNTFDRPGAVASRAFTAAALDRGAVALTMPPASVVTLELTP